ncbi:HAD family hydrolase [Nocardia sp. NBC_01503]|uniref:HAD family hydrolase n=1 Tax=Nocardia sp. NBC_01503 TaxID=2975997 RepID=UPI002E7B723E|nr:HAD-IIB family hydrolase [Nocardia sp. NBC_01503]WTL29423.1 HAD family hydrolase [Nocardia sp. NBC_01503]
MERDVVRPRLIALDVDGTILSGGQISARVRAAVRAAATQAHVVITTGRTVLATRPVLDELGLIQGQALCSNGAVCVDVSNSDLIDLHTFDPEPVVRVLRAVFPDMVLSVEKAGVGTWSTAPASESARLGEFRVVGIEELGSEMTPRLNGFWPSGTLDMMVELLSVHVLPGADWVHGEDGPWIVASPQGVSKGWALERLRQRLDIPIEATAAIGDGFNDLGMLSWAGYSVAMDNAVAPVRALADEITSDVTDDGAALVLERWFGH